MTTQPPSFKAYVKAAILLALVIAATIVVVVTVYPRTTPIEDIVVSNNFGKQKILLQDENITLVYTDSEFDYNQFHIPCSKFGAFLNETYTCNVSHIATDYQPFYYPDYVEPNTLYYLGSFRFWFYVDIANVGRTAVVYTGFEHAYLRSVD